MKTTAENDARIGAGRPQLTQTVDVGGEALPAAVSAAATLDLPTYMYEMLVEKAGPAGRDKLAHLGSSRMQQALVNPGSARVRGNLLRHTGRLQDQPCALAALFKTPAAQGVLAHLCGPILSNTYSESVQAYLVPRRMLLPKELDALSEGHRAILEKLRTFPIDPGNYAAFDLEAEAGAISQVIGTLKNSSLMRPGDLFTWAWRFFAMHTLRLSREGRDTMWSALAASARNTEHFDLRLQAVAQPRTGRSMAFEDKRSSWPPRQLTCAKHAKDEILRFALGYFFAGQKAATTPKSSLPC